jgi:hypothetical protein
MAPITVKNDAGHAIAIVRTHGRSGWIEVHARRRWNTTDARNVAAALVTAADAQDNRPDPPPVTEDPHVIDAASIPRTAEALVIDPPPRHGRGASRGAWATFVGYHNIPVTPDMGRDDIIAAYDATRRESVHA